MGANENAEAAFIARMTASTTHELRNVLAVVKESAGLVEDLTLAVQQRKAVNPDKLLQATRRIEAQVGRGADLLTGLSRLAHGLDHPVESIDLGQHARQVAFLCQRFARQRRQRVDVEGGDGVPCVRANSLAMQMALTAAIDCCIEQWPEETAITIGVEAQAGRPVLGFRGVAKAALATPAAAKSWERLRSLAAGVGGAIETDGTAGFRLVFASSPTA